MRHAAGTSWVWVVVLVGLAGCTREKRGAAPAAPGRTAVPALIDAAPPAGRFDADGWEVIRWGMSESDARAALAAAGIAFKPEEMRAYFASPKPGQAMHTNTLFLRMERPPLQGMVHYESGVLEGVSFQAPAPFTEAQARAHLAALVKRYGPGVGTTSGTQEITTWESATTRLQVIIGSAAKPDAWSLFETWSPTAR